MSKENKHIQITDKTCYCPYPNPIYNIQTDLKECKKCRGVINKL